MPNLFNARKLSSQNQKKKKCIDRRVSNAGSSEKPQRLAHMAKVISNYHQCAYLAQKKERKGRI